MPADSIAILAMLFLAVGMLYAAVGHAGASGYLAVMALMGVDAASMRPTALVVNIVVAAIAFTQFSRAGHFRWALFWPFAATSVPTAFVGGMIHLPAHALKVAIGAVLVITAARMAYGAWRPPASPLAPRPPHLSAMLVVGAMLGLVAGLTGTGGGIFLSPVLLLMRWADPKCTAATASLFILVNSVSGAAGVLVDGWVPPTSLMPLAACAAVGGIAGATIGSRKASPRILNVLLAAVLLVAGVKLVLA